MSDLRDAAELAFTALENTCPNNWTSVKENLRKALAQPEYEFECPRCGHCCQQREWVGLTDEEAWKCWDWEDFQGTWKSMESKLKDKNT